MSEKLYQKFFSHFSHDVSLVEDRSIPVFAFSFSDGKLKSILINPDSFASYNEGESELLFEQMKQMSFIVENSA